MILCILFGRVFSRRKIRREIDFVGFIELRKIDYDIFELIFIFYILLFSKIGKEKF